MNLANIRCMPDTPENQLKTFIAKFDRNLGKQIRECRSAIRKRFPTANELVYDNYNFFVIGYCSTERPSDCVVSIAAAASGVGICFTHGAQLPDPKKVLGGIGKQTRFLRLESSAVLDLPEVKSLLRLATDRAKAPMPVNGRGKLIIRSVSRKQRPRRK